MFYIKDYQGNEEEESVWLMAGNRTIRQGREKELRDLAYRLSSECKSSDYIALAVRSKIVGWGVSNATAKSYIDTLVKQVGKSQ